MKAAWTWKRKVNIPATYPPTPDSFCNVSFPPPLEAYMLHKRHLASQYNEERGSGCMRQSGSTDKGGARV